MKVKKKETQENNPVSIETWEKENQEFETWFIEELKKLGSKEKHINTPPIEESNNK